MTPKKVFAYLFALIALIFEGFFGIVPFVGFLLQLGVISVAVYLLVSIFRRKNPPPWKTNIARYMLTILATIGFFTTSFLAFIGYQYQFPGLLSDITLTSSGQEIVFVEMSHIATPEFYSTKKATIATLAENGYTILFEGVRPGTPENQAIFNKSIGFNFTPSLYSGIANIIGLESQDNVVLFDGIATGSLVSVDVSIDDIIRMMGTGTTINTGSVVDIESALEKNMTSLSSQERIFIGWLARGILSWSLKQSGTIDTLMASPTQARLFDTIVDRRNDSIVAYILAHPTEKIAIVYGALHFNGVYRALQKHDSHWQISKIETRSPYIR